MFSTMYLCSLRHCSDKSVYLCLAILLGGGKDDMLFLLICYDSGKISFGSQLLA